MKFLLAFLLIFPAYAQAKSLSVTLTDNNAGSVSCSPTVTTNCVSGWNVYETTGTRTLLGSVPADAVNKPGGPVAGSFTLAVNPPFGTHTIVATAVAKSGTGTTLESPDSVSANFSIGLVAPTGLTGNVP